MRNPYEILGLQKNAGEADIKKAYRKLAKTLHPDRNQNDPRAKDKFSELNAAYEILGDADKRIRFDRGEIDAEGKPRASGFEGFQPRTRGGKRPSGFQDFNVNIGAGGPQRGGGIGGDIFSQIFGDTFKMQGASPSAPEEVAATFNVTLEDIASGAPKRIVLPNREVEVTLPKGVVEGQTIRLRGLGHANPLNGQAGDVLLTIHIMPHRQFTVEGDDIRVRLPLDLEDAVLGAPLRVPTLTGSVDMTIPPMTSSGRTFRLKGKGLPGKQRQGDLLVTPEIRLPDDASGELAGMMRRFRSMKATAG